MRYPQSERYLSSWYNRDEEWERSQAREQTARRQLQAISNNYAKITKTLKVK